MLYKRLEMEKTIQHPIVFKPSKEHENMWEVKHFISTPKGSNPKYLSFLKCETFSKMVDIVMCPHEKYITFEEICVMFILLALFMNVKLKRMLFIYIGLIFKRHVFQPSIINSKLFDAS
jgi:hypothetical protein